MCNEQHSGFKSRVGVKVEITNRDHPTQHLKCLAHHNKSREMIRLNVQNTKSVQHFFKSLRRVLKKLDVLLGAESARLGSSCPPRIDIQLSLLYDVVSG